MILAVISIVIDTTAYADTPDHFTPNLIDHLLPAANDC